MNWEPKESFDAVAEYYGSHRVRVMLTVFRSDGFDSMVERTRDTTSGTVFQSEPIGPAELDPVPV